MLNGNRYFGLAGMWKKVNRPQLEVEILPPSSTMMDTYASMLLWCTRHYLTVLANLPYIQTPDGCQ